jgi:hypothetical protein
MLSTTLPSHHKVSSARFSGPHPAHRYSLFIQYNVSSCNVGAARICPFPRARGMAPIECAIGWTEPHSMWSTAWTAWYAWTEQYVPISYRQLPDQLCTPHSQPINSHSRPAECSWAHDVTMDILVSSFGLMREGRSRHYLPRKGGP